MSYGGGDGCHIEGGDGCHTEGGDGRHIIEGVMGAIEIKGRR